MKKITYNNLDNILIEEFPEFKKSKEYEDKDKEFKYAFIAGFSRFIVQMIDGETFKQEFIQRVFSFINDIYNGPEISKEDGSDTVQNLFYVEIFENLAQSKLAVEMARQYLQGKAKLEFETVFEHTGV